jgi:hypothetical protein
MRNTNLIASALLVLLVATHSFAGNKTFKGVVTDDMCVRKHTMMPGKPDADCIRACVKAGSKHALLVGDKVYKLENKTEQVDKLAGQQVNITGTLVGENIRVDAVAPGK